MTNSIEKRAAQWAAGRNTGVSSKAILGVMVGKPPESRFCYPHDGGDLGRCIGLLEAVPEFRDRLQEMRKVGPEWAALIDHWDELEGMYRTKDDRLYERMQEILDPIERKNPQLIKMGNGASLYFGR
jgi:hypothetical protein